MAAKIGQQHGNYDKDVCDSGEAAKKYLYDSPGQSKAKFANNEQKSTVKQSAKGAKQSINPPMDSGEGKAKQSNEGGQPKPSKPTPYSDKKKAPKVGAM